MPHQCTSCGRVFPDGSKEMLSGCPDCGGNKFQFNPSGSSDTSSGDSSSWSEPAGSHSTGSSKQSGPAPERSRSSDTATASGGASAPTSRDSSIPDASDRPSSDHRQDRPSSDHRNADRIGEDAAQAEARSDVVPADDLPDPSGPPGTDHASTTDDEPNSSASDDAAASSASETDSPDLDQLREELNQQFESIRIVSPGQYELNLMELYDRDEYIISLMEDGRYAIEVPEAWRD